MLRPGVLTPWRTGVYRSRSSWRCSSRDAPLTPAHRDRRRRRAPFLRRPPKRRVRRSSAVSVPVPIWQRSWDRSQPATRVLRPNRRDVPGGRRRAGGRLRPGQGRSRMAVVSTGGLPRASRDGGHVARIGAHREGHAVGPDERQDDARSCRRADAGDTGRARLRDRPGAARLGSDRSGDRPLRRPRSRRLQSRRGASPVSKCPRLQKSYLHAAKHSL